MADTFRFSVIDALDAPHGDGRVLRLRVVDGEPRVRKLRRARLVASSPDGTSREVRVRGFPVFGGKPSDRRIRETGRVDVHVSDDGATGAPPISRRWILEGPVR
jgi:hypothetical protein